MIYSNDIIQFGVEVLDSNTKMTHSCVIIRIKLYYPDGTEASRESSMFNIPTINMLPPYLSYTEMVEKERVVFEKLHSIEEIIEESHLLADMTLHVKKRNENLLSQLSELQNSCDKKEKISRELQEKINKLEDEIIKSIADKENDTKMIRDLNCQVKAKDSQIEELHRKLDKIIRQDHRLVTTLFLLLISLITYWYI